ncbi:MAG TPA: beta-ketoacyl synthase chain length factor [Steroidobacteraceae bacterium]|nr:beta-ketoacyl synthase chain length factor [Steroidobacteraceae bacterium]
MSGTLELTVAGFAVWDSPSGNRPQPSLLPPNERRRAPDTVALAVEVAQAACANAHRDPALLPTVFASTYGDMAITDYMCGTLATAPTMLSPTRFHNSVHNAAAGYWSIATRCRQPYCALGAGAYTFAAGLLAAALQVCADETDVLLVAYDIEARGPLAQVAHSRGMLGVALVLGASHEPDTTRLQLTIAADAPAAAAPAANAIAACLPLIAALEGRTQAQVSLPLGPDSTLQVRVQHA